MTSLSRDLRATGGDAPTLATDATDTITGLSWGSVVSEAERRPQSHERAVEDGDWLERRARRRVGQCLRGEWRLEALLAVGGMGAIYAAAHRDGRRAALKMLHVDLATRPDQRARFIQEGRVAGALAHPGVVAVRDADVDEEGTPFIVMDLLEGENLEERQHRLGILADDEALEMTDQLLDVLAAVHDRGVVHCDIKPANVFLTNEGSVKLLDFGIAHVPQAAPESTTVHPGHAMGTPAFMAPEQARGCWGEVDAQSDLWSIGATLFSLLTNRDVHERSSPSETLLAAAFARASSIATFRRDLPRAVCAVVDRALAFRKEERWGSARAMQRAIRDAIGARTRAWSVSGW